MKFKDSGKCLYINKYLEVLNHQYTVKDIHHGPIEPLVVPGWELGEICYYLFHITHIQYLGVFP